MNDQKITRALILLLVVMNIGSLTMVWMSYGTSDDHPPTKPPVSTDFLKAELGWNEAQLAEFEQLRSTHHDKARVINEELRGLKQSMFEKVVNDTPDEQIDEITTQIGTKQAELDRLTYLHFRDVRDICEGDQKAKFDQLWQEIKSKGLPGPRNRR